MQKKGCGAILFGRRICTTVSYTHLGMGAQTYPHFELLVINDCSTDRTVELVKKIATQDKRVRLISNQKTSGVSYTRKHGLDEARGSWIAILDSDDAWAPEKMERQIALQEKTNAELLFTGSAFMDADGQPID